MHKAIDDALKCRHPGRRWKRKLKRARRVYARCLSENNNVACVALSYNAAYNHSKGVVICQQM